MAANDPRYTVRAVRFVAVDESGPDRLGSDEPFWVFTAADPNGEVHTVRSRVFGDVDSDETRTFASENSRNVVWPEKGDTNGSSGPIALTIQLWEQDQGDLDGIAKKTELAFAAAGKLPPLVWLSNVPSIVRDKIAKFIGNDLMGSKTILYQPHELAKRLPKAGNKMLQRFRFGGNSGDLPFEVAGGPDYDLFLEVERVA
jgi:hypothetical protein